MDPFPVMSNDDIAMTAILVPHGRAFPSFALRVDTGHGSVTFSGDTAPSGNLIKLAQGTDILLHEAVFIEEFAKRGTSPESMEHLRTTHTDITELGWIAREANAKSVVLTHIAPDGLDHQTWVRGLRDSCKRAGYRGTYDVARDGQDILTRQMQGPPHGRGRRWPASWSCRARGA
jgi:ribonuclease BN (tRNA processing enzyme)